MSNQTFGSVAETRQQRYERFDALTPRMRMLIAFAPYDYAVRGALKLLKKDGEARALEFLKSRILQQRDEQIVIGWGPDHPMIGSRIPERKPLRRRAL